MYYVKIKRDTYDDGILFDFSIKEVALNFASVAVDHVIAESRKTIDPATGETLMSTPAQPSVEMWADLDDV